MLRDSVRTFYYQRSGTPIPARYGGNWHHRGGHLGRDQDRAAQYTQGGKALGRPRDLLGGWFDAGDLNKYVPYLESTLFDLLWAYELHPRIFRDDTNIPESGNGVPDLLDEVKWELDWLLKMQDTDGGVFNRVAGRSFDNGPDPPASDTQPRFYTAKTTWATATAAASFAHAARGLRSLRSDLPRLRRSPARRRAPGLGLPRGPPRDGARPTATDGDTTLAATPAGSNPNADRRSRVYAAAELFKTTRRAGLQGVRRPLGTRRRRDRGERPASVRDGPAGRPAQPPRLTQALFIYATTPGATPAVTRPFRDALARTGGGHPRGHGRPGRPLPRLSLRGATIAGAATRSRAAGAASC